MILQSLARLYDRLLAEGRLEAPGFQRKEILWLIGLNPDGSVAGLRPTGRGKERPRRFTVPEAVERSGQMVAANLLWDNAEYSLGITNADAKRAINRHTAFVTRIRQLPPEALADAGVAAVLAFLDKGDLSVLQASENWGELAEGGANVSFHLVGDENRLVCERPAVRAAIAAKEEPDDNAEGNQSWCLVTGKRDHPKRLHDFVKGMGGPGGGLKLVSFDKDAFTSHGWEQGDNAPVGETAARAYAAALNHMLERRPGDEMVYSHREGETTFLFWAESEDSAIGKYFPLALGERAEADPDTDGKPMKHTLNEVRRGLAECGPEDRDTAYYVLALAPNAARLSVRFWIATTVGDMAARFEDHFQALEIAGPDEDRPIPTLWRLIAASAPKGDVENYLPLLRGRLANDLLLSILKGTAYPRTLLARVIKRCRTEIGLKADPKHPKQRSWAQLLPLRVALIKAILCSAPEMPPEWRKKAVTLDPDCENVGYRLGRLFAVLEYLQYKAHTSELHQKSDTSDKVKPAGNPVNTTIRDTYFSAAMTSPLATYVQLEKLQIAHLKKLRRGSSDLARTIEFRIDEILAPIHKQGGLPPTLDLMGQGNFILGYHSQRHYRSPGSVSIADTSTHTDSDE